ncbi:M15 family metallopeptidase [Nocardioides sp. SOB77]|uniref:M15 family metallopeptidase n=1 Tax=Nocardioides oceani TaxID=3058369 RepID=A0ABT8FMS6_9ACTN|nr:M15 family metallopeptidase [Nocardioides oceani]MDN4175854.1 M15 family metallopeptidase [Nocardioides oceani]
MNLLMARRVRAALLSIVVATVLTLLAAACVPEPRKDLGAQAGGSQEATVEPEPTADAQIKPVSVEQWDRIEAVGAWRPGCPATREGLRRVEVNHWRFDGSVARGVLVVNKDVAAVVADIFTRLFDEKFPIRKMRPVEEYDGDTNASLRDDNTSAYNCRRLDQINAPVTESPHANGRAIDINPRENPWLDLRCDCWLPTARTKARTPGPGVIYKGGLVWDLFTEAKWIWQNIDVPDYMHFDTGYPSAPYRG